MRSGIELNQFLRIFLPTLAVKDKKLPQKSTCIDAQNDKLKNLEIEVS